MAEEIETMVKEIAGAKTGLFHTQKIYVALTDTNTLSDWQQRKDLRLAARNAQANHATVAGVALTKHVMNATIDLRKAVQNAAFTATGQPHQEDSLSLLQIAEDTPAPNRTAVVFSTRDERGHYHQLRAFIGDCHNDGAIYIDTLQDERGLTRFNENSTMIPVHALLSAEGWDRLTMWENSITSSKAPLLVERTDALPINAPFTLRRLPPVDKGR